MQAPDKNNGSGGYREVWLAGQAWEEALEAESLEQSWDKSLGKKRKTGVHVGSSGSGT